MEILDQVTVIGLWLLIIFLIMVIFKMLRDKDDKDSPF
jgi:hypothetical protein